MPANGCHQFISFLMLCLLSFHYANCLPKERENRHLLPLLGYLHGYKIGQDFAYQLPSFILSPVVIVPSVNQQQSVNVQKSTAGENYQENGGTFQIISPSKLIMNVTETSGVNGTNNSKIKEPSEIVIRIKTDLLSETNMSKSILDTFRQVTINDTDVPAESHSGAIEEDNENVTSTTDTTNSGAENLKVTTRSYGPYSNAVYKNENISLLSITTAAPFINTTMNSISPAPLLQYNVTLPNVEKNETGNKENFDVRKNLSNNNDNTKENTHSTVKVPLSFRGYSYRNPWYNLEADKISITTSSRTNYESPVPFANNDRWQNFSSLRKYPTSDFRPLASLYHDGFLHKYLIKNTGFVPVNSKYLNLK